MVRANPERPQSETPIDETIFVDSRDPARLEKAADFIERTVVRYHRGEVRGIERIPRGAGLYVGNHNAGMWTPDTYIFGAAVYRARGVADFPFALGHMMVMRAPRLGDYLTSLGGMLATPHNGERALRAGFKVLVYPGGDIDAYRPYRRRNEVDFFPRRGYIRLALRTGVPIIPVISSGAHESFVVVEDFQWLAERLGVSRWLRFKAWPLILSLPWGLTLGPLPFIPFPSKVLVEVLDPIHFERSGDEASRDRNYVEQCAQAVERRMEDALQRLAIERQTIDPLAGPLDFVAEELAQWVSGIARDLVPPQRPRRR